MNRLMNMLQRHNLIRNKIFFSILLFLIIPFVLTFYYMDKPLQKVIEARIGNSAQEAFNLINMNIEFILLDMYKSGIDISKDPNIIDMLKNPNKFSEFDKVQLKNKMLNKLSGSNYTAYVTIMDLSGHLFSTRYTEPSQYNAFTSTDWYKDLIKEPNKTVWMFTSKNFTFVDKQPILSMVKNINEFQLSRKIGVLLFSVPEENISKYLLKLEGDNFIIDEKGVVISSPIQAKLGKPLSGDVLQIIGEDADQEGQKIIKNDQGKWIVNYHILNQTKWKIVQIISYDSVFKEIFNIRKTNVIIVSIIFIIFIMITLSISYGVSKPLKLLARKMRGIENTQLFNTTLTVSGSKEITILIETYNKMMGQIHELMDDLKVQYQQKEELRFQALQAQINPHFILNTLNNIKWMAYIRKDTEVAEMLSCMGSIMEASIGKDGSLITLEQEINYIKNYITLMKIKYNEKLSVNYSIPNELFSNEVIKFMLQPIIENSINHGIDRLKGKGEITITAERQGEVLKLTVSDNGHGIEESKLQEIKQWLASQPNNQPNQRIGIINVQERIQLQYGDTYGITINSKLYIGTIVEYTLPYKLLEKGEGYAAEGYTR
jgi:two-component system sensor histidine kinase YesM